MAEKESGETGKSPWSRSYEKTLEKQKVSKEKGLSESEARRRREKYGSNKLRESKRKSRWTILADQFKSLLVVLLAFAAAVALLFGETIEGISIAAVLLINAAIGFITEFRAISSMEALQEMTKIDTHVRREDEVKKVSAETLVPGDIVTLHSGNMIPADLRIVESSKLQVDESTLTGESVPVSKSSEPVDEDVPLAERNSMLYKGTYLARGTAEAVVVSTGMDTELGKISESIEEAEEEKTPLEDRLDKLAQRLIPLLIAVAAIVAVAGYLRGMELLLMVETSIALAVATVPEGLPIVATLALARGMWRMADHNALVKNLSSVETLGSTNVICTDKTGTLTENRMTVDRYETEDGTVGITGTGFDTEGDFLVEEKEIDPSDNEVLRELLEVGVLCNNASFREEGGEKGIIGDPMEVSLLIAGLKGGIDRKELIDSMPESREVSFDPSVKMMATYHETDGSYKVAVKGAPEKVLEACSRVVEDGGSGEFTREERGKWARKSERMAENGLRVLALAKKEVEDVDEPPYENLTFLGLVGMRDPPRKDVKSAIKKCQDAGIRVVMVTGDHAATARNVGYSVGLIDSEEMEVIQGTEIEDLESLTEEERQRFEDAPIFARVSPENKLDLIEIHQKSGSVVAMTGDGVNDAPALKKADIGVAMGERGTQVAREASDMILRDDNFSTITRAVEEGRIIFNNIRKFVLYLMSCNISELLAILFAFIIGFHLPLLPLQILFLNVVNDIFPAFALGACKGGREIMDNPPRDPEEPILTRTHWSEMGFYGVLISVATVLSFGLATVMYPEGVDINRVVTVSFLTLAFCQLWHIFNMRELASGIFRNEITENKYVWGALGLCSLLLVASVYMPGLSTALKTKSIGLNGWLLALGMSLIPLVFGQLEREIRLKI